MGALVSINGRIFPPEQAMVSVFDRGFLFGDGVYETGKSLDRCFLYLEEHWERLRRSAGKLLIPLTWSDRELEKGLADTARQFDKPSVYFRTIVTRGLTGQVGLEQAATSPPTLVHIIQDLTDPSGEKAKRGVHLLTSKILRNSVLAQDPNIKSSSYLNSLLALQEVKSRGGEDAVLCNGEGQVTEGTTFSIFGITDRKTLLTPALSIGILDSITRRHVLTAARRALTVEEGFYPLPSFQACVEIFIASSVRGIVPVREWDGRAYPAPGPETGRLQGLLGEDMAAYVRSHSRY